MKTNGFILALAALVAAALALKSQQTPPAAAPPTTPTTPAPTATIGDADFTALIGKIQSMPYNTLRLLAYQTAIDAGSLTAAQVTQLKAMQHTDLQVVTGVAAAPAAPPPQPPPPNHGPTPELISFWGQLPEADPKVSASDYAALGLVVWSEPWATQHKLVNQQQYPIIVALEARA